MAVRDDELGGDATGKQVRYINAFRVLVTFASGQALSGESVSHSCLSFNIGLTFNYSDY